MGTNLTSRDVQLVHDGVSYTPLQSTQSDWLFLLGSNGTNVITVNGRWLCTIVVEGVPMPDGLPTTLRLINCSAASLTPSQAQTNVLVTVDDADCINLPVRSSAEFPYFVLRISGEGFSSSDFGGENREILQFSADGGFTRLCVQVRDTSLPAYVTIQGYIVAVFNYSD